MIAEEHQLQGMSNNPALLSFLTKTVPKRISVKIEGCYRLGLLLKTNFKKEVLPTLRSGHRGIGSNVSSTSDFRQPLLTSVFLATPEASTPSFCPEEW